MSNFTACTFKSSYYITIYYNSATYTCSKCNHYNAVVTFSATLPHFT